jgi:hypothetical protein
VGSGEKRDLGIGAVRFVAVALGLAVAGLSFFVVLQRFRYPIDAEWMVGAVRDGVERVRDGKPLYTEPGSEWVPFIYGPLYTWIAAAVAHVTSVFVACKLVSLLATAALGWGILQIARILGASPFWSWLAVLAHVACYPVTLYFFDLERVDMLAAAVVMLGVVAIMKSEKPLWTAVGGALLGLAFFGKQMNVVGLAAVALALAVTGQRRRAAIVAVSGAVVLALGLGWLEATTGPWFRYYCLKLPGTHGVEGKLLTVFFIADVPKAFALAAATVAVLAPFVSSFVRTRRPPADASWQDTVFAVVLAAVLAGAYFMRVHRGGWVNVILLWTPFACIALAVVSSRLEERAKGTALARAVPMLLAGGVALQFLGGIFDPNDNAPNEDDWGEHVRLVDLVKRLEREGEVVVTTRGNITTPRHAHAAAVYDILRAGLPPPKEIAADIEQHKYAAIFVADPGEYSCDVSATCRDMVRLVERNYFAAAKREEREHTGMTGYDARPRWILRPRKHVLPESISDKELWSRVQVEMGFADLARRRGPFKTELMPDDTIEERAARGDGVHDGSP